MTEVSRLTRRQLYDLVWSEAVDTLAKRFGMSGRGLAKLCERHGIPVPPRGYWAQKAAGKRTVRPPLVEIERPAEAVEPIILQTRPKELVPEGSGTGSETAGPDPYKELWDRVLADLPPIKVPARLTKPHRAVAALLAQEERERESWRRWPSGSMPFRPRYGSPLQRRRLRILSTLLTELERRGFTVEQDRQIVSQIHIRHERDEVDFELTERIRQYRRELTEQEKAKSWSANQKWRQEREATGELRFRIKSYAPKGIATSWQDDADSPLEQKLHLVIAGIVVVAAHLKQIRQKREAEERRRREVELEAWRQEERRKAELARREVLLDQVSDWRTAAEVRSFVATILEAVQGGKLKLEGADQSLLDRWGAWALKVADDLDPTVSGVEIPPEPEDDAR